MDPAMCLAHLEMINNRLCDDLTVVGTPLRFHIVQEGSVPNGRKIVTYKNKDREG
jgi:hypothetical protein